MSNHVDRVRSFLRLHAEATGGSEVAVVSLQGVESVLRVADVDALCRDAERLAVVEDI